jgi:hypothetical protein
MSGLLDYIGGRLLEFMVGKTAMPALPTCYLALLTTLPNEAGAGGVETDYAGYVRKQTAGTDWNNAAGSAPRTLNNAAKLTFASPTGDPTNNPVIAAALMDAASGGNYLALDYLGAFDWLPFFANTDDIASCKAHSCAANDRVVFSGEFGGTLPTGITAGTLYHVITDSLAADGFKVSATQGGAAVNITATGNGMLRKVTPMQITNGVVPSFDVGALMLKAV